MKRDIDVELLETKDTISGPSLNLQKQLVVLRRANSTEETSSEMIHTS